MCPIVYIFLSTSCLSHLHMITTQFQAYQHRSVTVQKLSTNSLNLLLPLSTPIVSRPIWAMTLSSTGGTSFDWWRFVLLLLSHRLLIGIVDSMIYCWLLLLILPLTALHNVSQLVQIQRLVDFSSFLYVNYRKRSFVFCFIDDLELYTNEMPSKTL